jgi:hypothetical protein
VVTTTPLSLIVTVMMAMMMMMMMVVECHEERGKREFKKLYKKTYLDTSIPVPYGKWGLSAC